MSLIPPRPQPVPLNALRAFEVAARHSSFLRAAEELSVTPGAIAQQVRKLEGWAGVRLFERQPHGVKLTPHGRQVLARLTSGFEQIGEAARLLRQASGTMHLRLAALPAIAQLWLSPRVSDLRAALPGCEISIHALDERPCLTHGAFDLALYPASETADHQITLVSNSIVPIAAPGVASTIHTPEDLAGAVLIHDAMWHADWAQWCAAIGLQDVPVHSGPVYSLYSLAVERCLSGEGVLIGHTALLERHLREGTLVALFPEMAVARTPICLTIPSAIAPGTPLERAVVALQNLAPDRD